MKTIYSSPRLTILDESLPSHGAGPLYALTFKFSKFKIRLHAGGYGNVKGPGGCFTLLPKITHYRQIATHLDFLNFGISLVYSPW